MGKCFRSDNSWLLREIMKHYHFLFSLRNISWSLEPPCKHGYPASCTLKRLWIALTQIQARCPKILAAAALPPTIQPGSSLSGARHAWISSQKIPALHSWLHLHERMGENHQLQSTSRTIGNKNKTIFLILSQEVWVVYFVAMNNQSTFFSKVRGSGGVTHLAKTKMVESCGSQRKKIQERKRIHHYQGL